MSGHLAILNPFILHPLPSPCLLPLYWRPFINQKVGLIWIIWQLYCYYYCFIHIFFNMNRGSLHTRSFSCIHFSDFRVKFPGAGADGPSKTPETFRTRKSIFSWPFSKNRDLEIYTTETFRRFEILLRLFGRLEKPAIWPSCSIKLTQD